MSDYDNTNRFTLSKNTKKREGKRDADYTGSVNVNGVEYWLNGWITNGKNGPFISGGVRPKDAPQEERPNAYAKAKGKDPISTGRRDMDDEIPFAPEVR